MPGTVLAERYRIVARLGRGGMGEVYRAEDLKLGQAVALKFLPSELERDQAARERLLAEVRMARTISHPNVCRVYDIGEVSSPDGTRSFLTMEYIDGEDLSSLLRRIGRLPPAKALEVARQLCAGLAAAHDKGVLHRDLKPANVMIDGRGHARIADFGIAVEKMDATPNASTNDHAGTLAYMAPERFAGKPATVQSDLYALGLILYETYTGKSAFSATTQGEWQRAHTDSAPSNPSAIVADIEPAVERAILRCLDKDPSRRPPSASHVAAALPGGDPLAAAIAAGETPSPELVAASGDEGTLPRSKALLWLAAIVIALTVAVALMARVLLINHTLMPLDTNALERKGREILVSLGYSTPPVDWVGKWANEGNSSRGGRLPLVFSYRQSPDSLFDVPVGPGAYSQRANYIEDAVLTLDPEGRLRGMDIGGVRDYSDTGGQKEVDWAPLLAAIGASVPPVPSAARRWPPAYYADTRAAWTATIDGELYDVEGAALRGRPTSLRVRRSGAANEASQPRQTPGLVAVATITITVFLSVPVLLSVFAYRNIRLGRGDRRGAFRLAAFVFSTSTLFTLLSRHWNPEQPALFAVGILTAAMLPLVAAVGTWVIYIAIEPYVRRRWPRLLVGWTRLLDGRLRDGLVGQALLIGVAAGSLATALSAATGLLHESMGIGRYLYDTRWSIRAGWLAPFTSAANGAMVIGLLTLGRIVFRRDWIAWLLLWMFTATVTFADAITTLPPLVALSESLVFGALAVLVLYRFGLLTYVIMSVVSGVLNAAPLTLDTTRWYFWHGVLPVAIVLALAIWGFKNVLGKQALLPAGFED